MLKKEYFLPTITTTKPSDWQGKIKEIDQLSIDKLAVFPTCFKEKQRLELYGLLEQTKLKQIPFVHIRGDMSPKELDYLIKRWKAQVFNLHSPRQYPVLYNWDKYKKMIYIENTLLCFNQAELEEFAGICLDLSHLEQDKRTGSKRYNQAVELIKKYPIGCNHISGIAKKPEIVSEKGITEERYDAHYYRSLRQFDYLTKYPASYFAKFIAIELENPLEEQLRAIEYILKLKIKN